ncbi:prolactin receptor-like [Vanacampus margaritifer]
MSLFLFLPAGDGMKSDTCVATIITLLLSAARCNSRSPPERPVLLGCRSPDKETFTCWWEPGVDGGLPTMHRLYYQRERLEETHECPDYRTAGSNACFFDRNNTSIWVDYYLTVVASNALGNATSDVLKVDVMDIVKPDVPEHVTLKAEDREESLSLHVSWDHPRNVDTRSGWVTLEYQLRARQQQQQGRHANKWKEYKAGRQTRFTLYGVHPGAVLVVQVRCRLDYSSWSSWTEACYVKIPNSVRKETPFWMSAVALSGFVFLAALCIVAMKRKSVIQSLLPPVPGPKIRGVDFQLVKSGRPEDLASALLVQQDFAPVMSWNDYADDDYLIVTDHNRIVTDHNLIVADHNAGTQQRSLPISADFNSEDDGAQQNFKNLKRPPAVKREVRGGHLSTHRSYVELGLDYSRVQDVTSDHIFLLESAGVPGPDKPPEDGNKVRDGKMLLLQEKSNQLERLRKPPPTHPRRDADLTDGGYVDAVLTPSLGKNY